MAMVPTTRREAPQAWKTAGHTIASRLFFDRKAEFWLQEIAPSLSLRPRARIIEIIPETPDAKTFVLRPNRLWKGHVAGQYVTIEVEIDGRRERRCYSISAAPGTGRAFSITVKRVAGGLVSNWLHEHAAVGDTLGIGRAAGDFVLPETIPARILFVTGGSGITPVFALLEELAGRAALKDVTLLHYAPTRKEVIFHDRLRALARRHRGFRLLIGLTREKSGVARFAGEHLRSLVPDFRQRETWLCGPEGLRNRVTTLWEAEGIRERLHEERFVATIPVASTAGAPRVTVTLGRSGRTFETKGSGTLLEQAERAGANPAFGCRMGICQTCKCVKRSGAVQNLRTGAISNDPDETIQLCISIPRSDVEIDL
jgi:ferredoxin-NADP reductase